MNKLLRANFARMWKSRSFWLGVLVMCGLLLWDLAKAVHYVLDTPEAVIDPSVFLFMRCMPVLLVVAVFTGFFVGTENSNKTVNNKIIAGHSRTVIYLANLVVCSSAGLIFYLTPMVLTLGLGIPLLGPITGSPDILLGTLLSSMLTIIAAVSIFTALSTLISNNAIGIVTVVLLCLGMISFSGSLRDALLEPEYIMGGVTTIDGEVIFEDAHEKNPLYLDGVKRTLYQITFDFLPAGQMEQYSSYTLPENVGWFPVYSGIVTFLTSAIGIWGFRKKDLA